MKKLTGLFAVIVLMLGLWGLAEAKTYKSLSVPDCQVEIPDDAAVPAPERFGLANYDYAKSADGCTVVILRYLDDRYLYYDDKGNEVFPYTEIVKFEKTVPHLVGLAFPDGQDRLRLYSDDAMDKPATDKLEKSDQQGPQWKRAPRSLPYKSLAIPNYTAEIAGLTAVPDTGRFTEAVTRENVSHDGCRIVMKLYQDPQFRYVDEKTGEEIYPYMELVKEKTNGKHLILIAFINAEVKIELYEDKGAMSGPAKDRLEKVTGLKDREIKRLPRMKTPF